VIKTYAYIDASNLFYGGEKDLGWKIDYRKLIGYLKEKYSVSVTFYFGGVEIHDFEYDYLKYDTLPLTALLKHLEMQLIAKKPLSRDPANLIRKHIQNVKFYIKLREFGYILRLKPIKSYIQENGLLKKKANCDVEMAYYLMREIKYYKKVLILSGDGDFLPVLKYLQSIGKEVVIVARASRTAKELKRFAGSNFRDFIRLKNVLEFIE